jgi:hypothetical protein
MTKRFEGITSLEIYLRTGWFYCFHTLVD